MKLSLSYATLIFSLIFLYQKTSFAFAPVLTCGFSTPAAWAARPPATVNISLSSDLTSSVVGLTDTYGGIGVKLELVNKSHSPIEYVNIIEGRSAAGAGWQTSYIIQDWAGGVGQLVFNQAAGNTAANAGNTQAFQWGFRTQYGFAGSVANANDWSPLYSDHVEKIDTDGNAISSTSYSPCINAPFIFDDGKVDVVGALVSTFSQGNAMLWTNTYTFKSRVNQAWPKWNAEQALYLDSQVARNGNLRIYLKKSSKSSVDLPIDPTKAFTVPGGFCKEINDSAGGTRCNDESQFDYAVFVWNIFGRDIGIAIPNLSGGISLNREVTTYCGDSSNLTCGNISFHAWKRLGAVNFPAGFTHKVEQEYYIGTIAQLAALGYSIQ